MPRRTRATIAEVADDEDRPLYKSRILDESMFTTGDYTGDSLDDVWDEDPDYVLKLLRDDDLNPADREEILQLVGSEEG